MAWKKGQTGNPTGRGLKRTLVSDSIVRELNEAAEDGDGTKARALAKTLVRKAIEGDTRAADIVLERVEGKAEQVINVNRRAVSLTRDELIAIASGEVGAGEGQLGDEPSVVH